MHIETISSHTLRCLQNSHNFENNKISQKVLIPSYFPTKSGALQKTDIVTCSCKIAGGDFLITYVGGDLGSVTI